DGIHRAVSRAQKSQPPARPMSQSLRNRHSLRIMESHNPRNERDRHGKLQAERNHPPRPAQENAIGWTLRRWQSLVAAGGRLSKQGRGAPDQKRNKRDP